MTEHLAIEQWEPWERLAAESNTDLLRERFDRVRNEIPGALVPELITLLDSGGEIPRRRAFVVLRELATADDPRLNGEAKAGLVDRVRAIARVEFPRTLLGRSAFRYLRESVDVQEAQRVLEALDPAAMTEEERAEVVGCILHFDSPRVRDMLAQIKAIGGHASHEAEARLEGRGLPDMARIRALARQWRETRAQETLHELYLRYFTHQGGKTTISEVIALMGPPDRRNGNSIWYAPNDWCSVYLEGDAKGVLRAMSFSG